MTTAARPLRLNTGRIRDQWHTMTRSGQSPRLGQHLPEPFVEVHPDDALKFGVTDDSFARVTTDYGQCTLKVVVSERQQRGMLFAPIHWSESTATGSRVGALVAPFTDAFSGQPENKATPASITPIRIRVPGLCAVAHAAGIARACLVGARRGARRLRLSAGRQCRSRGLAILAAVGGRATNLAEYKDFGGGVYRAATFAADRIEACLFIGPAHDAGDWNVIKQLFAAGALSDDQRRMLLSGKSIDGMASAGPIVCACFGVGRTTICDAIAAGAGTAAEIGAQLKAGTNCGSCIPEMKRLIAQAGVAEPTHLNGAAN